MKKTNEQLRQQSTRLVLALMASASTDHIPPKNWWDRATSALISGASRGSLDEMVSTMARKLQIQSLRAQSANSISLLASEAEFEPLRRYCERNPQMVVALARVERDRQKAEAGNVATYRKPIEQQLEEMKLRAASADALKLKVAELEADNRALREAIENK